ncbi:MAG: hypothetical protein OC190_03030, partial [Novosphingobium aromaticivorans]|nr:hypothetical protein [Novosphingobium aromaticivorans]
PLRYSRFPAADAVQPQPWGFLFNPTGPFLNRCLARFYPGVDTACASIHAAKPAIQQPFRDRQKLPFIHPKLKS